MARGRKPHPTALKVLRGNPGKRPLPQSEPRPAADLPEPPAHLGAGALTEWQRLAPELHRIGVLTMADRTALAAYCVLYQRWEEAEKGIETLVTETANGFLVQHPCIGIANRALELMQRYMVELGLTPSSRSKIHAMKLPEEDALETFLRPKKKAPR